MTTEAENAAHCEALLREADRDRWLAGLFLRQPYRQAVAALYAFDVELSRIGDVVTQPIAGEVRLQWWRDALEGEARGDVEGHPVAAALLATASRYALPLSALSDMVDARTRDLYDDLLETVGDLEAYCGATSSALIRLATFVLGDGRETGSADAAGHAGVAEGITDLLRDFSNHALQGRAIVPREILERHGAETADILSGRLTPALAAALKEMRAIARRHHALAIGHVADVERSARGAFLGLSFVPLFLDAMERRGFDPFRHPVEPAQWRRQWALWRMARRL